MSLETDEIKTRLNIVDLIGEYVQLQKAGSSWKARCPFHNEKTPSFTVSEEKQFWHCFGCGKGGDAFAFLMEIEGLEFREVLENLAERTGVTLPKYQGEKSSVDGNKLREILELATKFYEKQLWEGSGKKKILKYLQERGLNEETIREFRLGYAPDGWRNILDFLKERGYDVKDILKTGLIIEKDGGAKHYDRFRDRIIFPICDVQGRVMGYSARVAPGGDETQAKYVNTPETEIYHKGNVLYGIDKAKLEIKEKDEVLLVEGNMDVIASYQAGIKNTVAVSGTALTTEQLKLIGRYTDNIKMFFDMDEAGQKASKKSSELAFENEMNVSVVKITEGKDAADAVKENPETFLSAVQEALPAMEYFLQQELLKRSKNNIVDKKKIIGELSGLINSFSNKIEKEYWIKELADRLDVSEEILFDTFNNLNKNNFQETPNKSVENGVLKNEVFGQDRLKNIQLEIMGLVLANSELWKEVAEKKQDEIKKYFSNQKIVDVILNKGIEMNFNFERLLEILEDENQKKFLREQCFDNLEKEKDATIDDKRLELEQYFIELKRENKREATKKIIEQIKEAEKKGDKKEVEKLAQELMKISGQHF